MCYTLSGGTGRKWAPTKTHAIASATGEQLQRTSLQ